MAEWTSAVGAAQLARLITSQQERPAVPGARKLPAYRTLADGIRLLVLEGRVPVAARLPAERELAVALSLSRTTVAAAYEALRGEGFLESRRGAGSWTSVPAGNPLPARGLEPLPPESLGSMIDLGCAALPAPEPWLTKAVQGALEELPPYAHTHGDYPAGLPALRRMLADRYTEQGIPTMPEQIMVTTGAMGAIDAICSLFAGRGERIAVESPSYANILQLMRAAGVRLVPVAMADGLGGWDMDVWRQVLRDSAPASPMSWPTSTTRPEPWPPTSSAAPWWRPRARPAPSWSPTRPCRNSSWTRSWRCPARSAPSTRPAARSSPWAPPARPSGRACGSAGSAPPPT